jgi:hypothetical protein
MQRSERYFLATQIKFFGRWRVFDGPFSMDRKSIVIARLVRATHENSR